MKMPISYLKANGRGYYLQKRVPQDLRTEYPTQTISKYLSADYDEARRKLPGELAALEQEFAEKRAEPADSLSASEIDRLAAIYVHEEMAADDEIRRDGLGGDDVFAAVKAQLADLGAQYGWTGAQVERSEPGLNDREYEQQAEALAITKAGLMKSLARGRTKIVQEDVADLLSRHRIKLKADAPAYRDLSLAVLKAAVKVIDLQLRRHAGELVDTPPAPPPSKGKPVAQPSRDCLSEIYERWKLERKPPEKTASDFWTYCRRFIELHGDLPVASITKRHVVDYKDALLRLPTKLPASHSIWPLPKILKEYADREDVPRLSSSTVNNKGLASIKALIGWASSNAICESNVASGVRVVVGKVQEDRRLPYSSDDLRCIFSFPIYAQNERPTGGAGEAAYWLPVLALYTGARLEELGSLRTQDCKSEAGTSFFDLTVVEPGKKLKAESSRRRIPWHPELFQLGLDRFVEAARLEGRSRLFPGLHSTTGEITANWSKWWGRYARDHGIDDRRKVFHSFRHAFKDACRNNGVSDKMTVAIQGHGKSTVADGYGLGYNVHVLAEAIAKVTYHGVAIPVWPGSSAGQLRR